VVGKPSFKRGQLFGKKKKKKQAGEWEKSPELGGGVSKIQKKVEARLGCTDGERPSHAVGKENKIH